MRRRLPSLPAVRAFEAAARHLSFRAAAAELCVTPSAISHQVRALEDHLGRPLFARRPTGIALTTAGAEYLAELTPILDRLDHASARAGAAVETRRFRVHCTPGFAARWLAPRLSHCPLGERIEITVSQGAPSLDFAATEADVAIAWARGTGPGVISEPLMESCQYPVAAPELAARYATPAALAGAPLLHDEVLDAWAEWFRLAGVTVPPLPRGPRLPHCELTLTAAERGQGVALAYDAMARGALASGGLIRLFETEVPAITIYSVAWPESRRRCPQIRAFRDWIFEEVAREGTRDGQGRRRAAG